MEEISVHFSDKEILVVTTSSGDSFEIKGSNRICSFLYHCKLSVENAAWASTLIIEKYKGDNNE